MGHVFISYSHKDSTYAHALADQLHERGIEVWIDERLDYGSQWPHEIQKQLDSCDAFLLVMSPRSFASDWVQSELQRAKRKLKPIFPLLLEGDETWLSVESIQYYDVRSGNFPDEKFYSALKRVLKTGSASDGAVSVPKSELPSGTVRPQAARQRGAWILGVGGGAVLLIICMATAGYLLFQSLNRGPSSPDVAATLQATEAVVSLETAPGANSELSTSAVEVPASTATPLPAQITDIEGVTMHLVPAGRFIMGSDNGDSNEKPVHEVELAAYYMDVHEVTNADYRACVDAGPCTPPGLNSLGGFLEQYYDDPQYDQYPVVYVNWYQARSYCNWRGAQLPTEAQWEKAARGTDGPVYPWGPYVTCDRANFGGCYGNTTTPVQTFQTGMSPYDLHDMAGNVWEWVGDWYGESYYQTAPTADPTGPAAGQFRVVRGGSFADNENSQRSSYRNRDLPENFNWNIGFRCAKDVTP